MFKLESNRLKREFKITNDNFYASQIMNKYSDMSFVPDGNGCEFVVFFTDGTEVSSKGLPVVHSSEENKKLKFVFAEDLGTTVTLEYWVHEDGNSICKQVSISQNNDKVIDRVFLENIGIVNSKTHFGIDPTTHKEGADFVTSLGQPFYIDSLFFGCESPSVDCKIIHGAGQIRYYLGKNVGKDFKCPVTVMGGGSDNTMQAMKKAFYEYIDFISLPSPLRINCVNTDAPKKAVGEDVAAIAEKSLKNLNAPDMPTVFSFVDTSQSWCAEKGEFWGFNKRWENGFAPIKAVCDRENVGFGVYFDVAGSKKLAKKIQKADNGFVFDEADELCCASAVYNNKLADYIISLIKEYSLSYIGLGFGKSEEKFCQNESHDHAVGGKNDMYYLNDLIERRAELVSRIRRECPDVHITLCGMRDVSPWWRQWVNTIGNLALSDGKGDALSDDYNKFENDITESDTVFFDTMCSHAVQLYSKELALKLDESDLSSEEFYKVIMWSVVRGEGLVNLTQSMIGLDDSKREALSRALKFKTENQSVLENCTFIGGRPADGNIYGFVSWNDDGGVIAMRNPTNEKVPITLVLNKLMGVPETLEDVHRESVYNQMLPETDETYSYGSKLEITLHPFECIIFKFTK
ncbi:MAG: hypothetical protein IKF64_05460 [Eubacterium sp.]|nr:hypothetical protein [Eubacterium sp.]